MSLSYWGIRTSQEELAGLLKPDPEDLHVSPDEMVAAGKEYNIKIIKRIGGTISILKGLVAGGFPVIAPTWHIDHNGTGMGHYRLVKGYNDKEESFILMDSLLGPDVSMNYSEFDDFWRFSGRMILLTYPETLEGDVLKLLGPISDWFDSLEYAFQIASDELNHPVKTDVYEAVTWLNLGSIYEYMGEYGKAINAFERSLELGIPDRIIYYQDQLYSAYYYSQRYHDLIEFSSYVLKGCINMEEAYYWRAKGEEALGLTDSAIRDYKLALEYRNGWGLVESALERLNESD
jgi:tetratricopeptide (TPR) repeat protein